MATPGSVPQWDTGLGNAKGGKSAKDTWEDIKRRRDEGIRKMEEKRKAREERLARKEKESEPEIAPSTKAAPKPEEQPEEVAPEVVPEAPSPPYVYQALVEDEDEEEPEKRESKSRSQWFRDLGYTPMGEQPQIQGMPDPRGGSSILFSGGPTDTIPSAIGPPTMQNYEIEQGGPPAPMRDLGNSFDTFLGASNPTLAMSSPMSGLPAVPTLLSVASEGLNLAADAYSEKREDAGMPTVGAAFQEAMGATSHAFGGKLLSDYGEYFRGFLNSGTMRRLEAERLDMVAAAREWSPEEARVVPIRERNAILAKDMKDWTLSDWEGIAIVNKVPAQDGSPAQKALYWTEEAKNVHGQARNVAGTNFRIFLADAQFALRVLFDGLPTYGFLELTVDQVNDLRETGELSSPEDAAQWIPGRPTNRGALESAVEVGSTLWRGIRDAVPGDSTEAMEVYGPNMRVSWVGKSYDSDPTQWAAFRDDVSMLAEQGRVNREYIESHSDSPEEYAELSQSYGFFASDAYRVKRGMDDVATFEAQKAQMHAEMRVAIASGDTVKAGDLQQRIVQEEQKSHIDILNNRASIMGEMMFGMFGDITMYLNPVRKILGFGELAQSADAARNIRRYAAKYGADDFADIVGSVDEVVQGLADGTVFARAKGPRRSAAPGGRAAGGVQPVGTGNTFQIIKEKINPFTPTPDTLANKDVLTIHTAFTPLMRGLTDSTDIMIVMDKLANDPVGLRKGITGVMSGSAGLTKDGVWHPTNSFFLSKDFQDAWPTLKAAWPEIAKMTEWTKDVPSTEKLIVEMETILLGTARRLYGDVSNTRIPVTAKAIERSGLDIIFKDGTGSKAGEISRVTAGSDNQVLQWERQFEDAITLGKGDAGAGQYYLDVLALQKLWMSNQNLNMDAGHWIRNALNATLAGLGDETYSMVPLAKQAENLGRVMGPIPDNPELYRLFSIEEGADTMTSGTPAWLRPSMRTGFGKKARKIVDGLSGFGPFGRMGSRVWTEAHVGEPLLKGGGEIGSKLAGEGTLKFSEQAVRDTIFHSAFFKVMRKTWKQQVGTNLVNPVIEQGMDPKKAKMFGQYIANQYATGKADLLASGQKWLKNNQLPFTVNMDRYQDLLDSRQLDDLTEFMHRLPTDDATANGMINQYMSRLKVEGAGPFRQAPTQPGTTQFFDKDIVDDAHSYIDDFTRLLRDPDSGVTPAEIEVIKKQAGEARDVMLSGLEGLADDLAQVGEEGSLTHMYDVLWEWNKARADWLIDKDNIYEAAGTARTPAAWAKARKDVADRLAKYTTDTTEIFAKARQDLFSPSGLPDKPTSVNQVMLRLSSFDEVINQQLREMGLSIRSVGKQYDDFTKARTGARELLDYGIAQMMESYRRYPSMDGFNTMADVMVKIDDGGAKLARHLQDLADMVVDGSLPSPLYQRYYNSAWNQYFDQMYEYIYASAGYVLESGLYQKADKTIPAQVRQVGRTTEEFFANMRKGEPLITRLPLYDDAFIPSNQDFYDWADILHIGTDKAQGKSRTMSGIAKFVREHFPDIDMTNRRGIAHLTDAERREVFAKMVEEFNFAGKGQAPPAAAANVPTAPPSPAAPVGLAGNLERTDLVASGRAPVPAVTSAPPPSNANSRALDAAVARTKNIKDGSGISFYDAAKGLIDGGTDDWDVASKIFNEFTFEDLYENDMARMIGQIRRSLSGAPVTAPPPNRTATNLGNLKLFSLTEGQDLKQLLFDVNKASQNVQGNKAYDWADVFSSNNKAYDMLRDDLWDIYKSWQTGAMDDVRNISPQEAVIFNDALRKTADTYDDTISMASHAGKHMGDFALLDYNRRVRADNWAALVWPYHYFWSRSAKNWARRLLDNPQFTNILMAYNDAKYRENQQSGVQDTYREGTVPSPFNAFTGKNDRITDYIQLALPNYGTNFFIRPEEANNPWEHKVDSVRQFLPGIGPAGQVIFDGTMDLLYPIEGGPSRSSARTFGDFTPYGRLLHYGTMWKTGKYRDWAGKIMGDNWDYMRIGSKVSSHVKTDEEEYIAGYVGQVFENKQNGRDDYYGMDDETIASIEEVMPAAISAVGKSKFITGLTSTLLGASFYPEDEHMNEMYEAKANYFAGGYAPDQPGGSTEFQRHYLDQNKSVSSSWNMGSLRPGASPDVKSPAERVEENVAWDAFIKASQVLQEKRAELLADDPYMTESDMWDATVAERDAVDAARKELPEQQFDPTEPMGPDNVKPKLKGSPTEKASKVFASILRSSEDLYPTPKSVWSDEEGAPEPSKAAMKEYFAERSRMEALQEKYLVSRLTWMVERDEFITQNLDGPDREWWNELRNILQGRSVQDWVDMYYGRYDSDAYFRWKQGWDLKKQSDQVVRDENRAYLERLVGTQFSQEQLAIFDEYGKMDDTTDDQKAAKKAFSDDNPFIGEMNAALYNNEEYTQAVLTWGQDWFDVQQGVPSTYSMFGVAYELLTEAQKQQYFTAGDQYLAEHPKSNEIQFWYKGRSFPKEVRTIVENTSEEVWDYKKYAPKSWGEDYDTAVELFGKDVFQVERELAQVDGQAFYRWQDANEARYNNYLAFGSWKSFYHSEFAGDPETMAYALLYDIAESERDALKEAALMAEASEDVIIPGTPTSAPNYWRGVELPGVGLLGTQGTLGALPPEVSDAMGESTLVSGDYVAPDPKQALDPKIAKATIPGTDLVIEDQVVTPMSPREALEASAPGMEFLEELLDEDSKAILAAGKGKLPEAPTTMSELLKMSDTYQKLVANEAKWAQWEANSYLQQEFASVTFGTDPKVWNMYFDLPKGGDGRKALKEANPDLEAALLFAFNQEHWPSAQEAGFSPEDIVLWAQRPDYNEDDTEPRTEFFRAHPKAFLFNSWVNGRYSGKDSDEPDYSRNWGVDYREAQEKFGEDIWTLVLQYRQLPSGTGARTSFRRDNPNYDGWSDWWYANLPGNEDYIFRTKYGGASYGGRSWSGGGGGGGGWSDNHDSKFPDGNGIFVSPYRQPNMPNTPRWSNPISATSDNWRKYASPNTKLMQWNRKLGS